MDHSGEKETEGSVLPMVTFLTCAPQEREIKEIIGRRVIRIETNVIERYEMRL